MFAFAMNIRQLANKLRGVARRLAGGRSQRTESKQASADGSSATDGRQPADEASPRVDDAADSEATGVETASEPLGRIKGIGPAYAERLDGAGVASVADLVAADVAALARGTGIAESRIQRWQRRGREILDEADAERGEGTTSSEDDRAPDLRPADIAMPDLDAGDVATLVAKLEASDDRTRRQAAEAVRKVAAERPELLVEADVIPRLRDLRLDEKPAAQRAAETAIQRLDDAGLY